MDTGERDGTKSGATRTTIVRRAGVVAVGTLSSRILGAVRDAVIAASFAIGATDAFFVAFTVPNALRVLLGEGAVSGAFIPVFSEVREQEGEERARVLRKRADWRRFPLRWWPVATPLTLPKSKS